MSICRGCDPYTNAWDSQCPEHGDMDMITDTAFPDQWPPGSRPASPQD